MTLGEKHLYTSDQKLRWFGPGEWVEEPDKVTFEHAGFKCIVLRIVSSELDCPAFGGHLCGYVQIPVEHPWYDKSYDEIECDCHGGLTFANHRFDDEAFWIGFDCAHGEDLTPSMPQIFETDFSWVTYKNINYAMEECKSIAEQAKIVKEKEFKCCR